MNCVDSIGELLPYTTSLIIDPCCCILLVILTTQIACLNPASKWLGSLIYGLIKIFRENWQSNLGFVDALTDVSDKLHDWNKQVFGNIFYKKQKLFNKLARIQRALES